MTVYEDLKGKVVLITGGAGGIGCASAAAFLEQGCKVVIVDIAEAPLAACAAKLKAPKDHLLTLIADASREDEVKSYVDMTVQTYGTIDVFFNNAGIEGKVAPLVDQNMADVDRVFDLNIRGVYLGLKHVLPIMYAKKSGSVINTSSVAGLGASSSGGMTPYVTSKFAVTGLTRAISSEAALHGVRVNSIHPSPVNTPMMRRIEDGYKPGKATEAKEGITAAIPMGRYAEAEDVAKAVVFLASEASGFITGDQLRVDGGYKN